MKKVLLSGAMLFAITVSAISQSSSKDLDEAVAKSDKAITVKDYQLAANSFLKLAASENKNWLAWYYAAFCNAKIGWLYERDGEKIEPYANLAEEQINKALSLIDTVKQKKELSEVYCILAMVNQAKVFINPETYGRQYGPSAFSYMYKAHAADQQNPRALYLLGWQKFATPKAWGGDKVKAKELLLAAKQKLENEPVSGSYPHWGKTEVENLLKQIK